MEIEEVSGLVAAADFAGVSRTAVKLAIKSGRLAPLRREGGGPGKGRPQMIFAVADLRKCWPDTAAPPEEDDPARQERIAQHKAWQARIGIQAKFANGSLEVRVKTDPRANPPGIGRPPPKPWPVSKPEHPPTDFGPMRF